MSHNIWLPQTKTKATVIDGKVKVWDEIEMVLEPVKPALGFSSFSPGAEILPPRISGRALAERNKKWTERHR